jgi:hypothetical protein
LKIRVKVVWSKVQGPGFRVGALRLRVKGLRFRD